MEPYEIWLTKENAKEKSEQIIDLVRKQIQKKSLDLKTTHEGIHAAAAERESGFRSMRSLWFFASVGVEDVASDGDKMTFFISKSNNAYVFCDFNIVPWTSWVGDLYTRIKNMIFNSGYPERIEYGPPNRYASRSLGPTVEYDFDNGLIRELRFLFGELDPEIFEQMVDDEDDEPTFGLNQIIQTIDEDQNEQIRLPDKGAFIFMGGPGVGKTTAALHRIPVLVNEQLDEDGERIRNPDDLFFKQDNALVVVWKEHLVPYLRKCIVDLDLQDFPEENVTHIDNWLNVIVRNYVSIGPGKTSYRLGGREELHVREQKLHLNEDDIRQFLESESEVQIDTYNSLIELFDDVRKVVSETGKTLGAVFSIPADRATVASDIVDFCQNLLSGLPNPNDFEMFDVNSDTKRAKIAELKKIIRKEESSSLQRISNYTRLLRDFYNSDIARAKLVENGISHEEFTASVKKEFKARSLSQTDTYFLAWIIYLQTNGSTLERKGHQEIRPYTHVLVDEAQYYEPIVLRLLASLSQFDRGGNFTIVGDLEQRIAAEDTGLTSWGDIGLFIPPENIRRLGVNYRSAEKVFNFLVKFKEFVKIKEELEPPRNFFRKGLKPEVKAFRDRSEEFFGIAQSIHEKKELDLKTLKSVAVVVPNSVKEAASDKLVGLLNQYGINARWATQLDVQESVDQVIVTDRTSIVGLEFDSVYFACTDIFFTSLESRDEIFAGWVALSRAKQFLHVSRVESDPVFDAPIFDEYRVEPDDEPPFAVGDSAEI